MTGVQIREALEAAGVRPSRQLGQNFLCDENVARWIVARLEAGPEDTVVEVGPGTGAMSEMLVGKVRRLIMVEFDARLAEWLTRRFVGESTVEVHHADAARWDVRQLWQHRPVKFLGNLPYSAGGAILKNFLSRPHPFERAVIMLQREVIERLCAVPRTKAYGVLTLRVQSGWRVRPVKVVGPEAFHPRPAVDSTVAVLEPLGVELGCYDGRLFDSLLRRGFAQRRKQLRKSMPESPAWESVADELGVSHLVRGEELTLEQWVQLARVYESHPLKGPAQRGSEVFDVVNERDEVTGVATRSEVHARGLLHRAVHVFVINRHGEVLLQRRSQLKDVHPGRWDSSVAGHLDSGEDYQAAAIREMAEEMGIEGVEPEEVARIAPSESTGWEHVRLYVVRWDGTPKFPSAEVESAIWMRPTGVDSWIRSRPQDFADGFLECWKAARGRDREQSDAIT